MKAVFVVNDLNHWICVDVVDSLQAANAVVQVYSTEDSPKQSFIVDLPAIASKQD